jgi:hypothetical protein
MATRVTEEADRRVAVGERLLDQRVPGWRRVVDGDALDLASCERCVLGQVFGDYERGLIALGISEEDEVIEMYGFNADDEDGSSVSYRSLRAAWRRVLRRR